VRIGQILRASARVVKSEKPPNGTTYIVRRAVLQFAYTRTGTTLLNYVNLVRNGKRLNGMRPPALIAARRFAFTGIGTVLLNSARAANKNKLKSGTTLHSKSWFELRCCDFLEAE
jgi:hypothetical protein